MPDQLSSDLASLRINRDTPKAPSALRKLIFPILVIAAIGVVALVGWQKVEGQVFKQEVKTTEIAMISPSQADTLVTATGYVIPQITSKVGAKMPGRIAKVMVKEGDTVTEGQVIAQLEDQDQKSQVVATTSRVGVANARISTAKANLAEVSQQVTRERALVASGAVGKANLENLVAREAALRETVRATEAEANAAHADVGAVNVGLKDRVIIAPIGGRIVTKPATIGEFVGGVGNIGLVAEIVDFNSLMIEADVPEARLHLVKLGGPCEIILDAYPNKRYRCTADSLGQRVNRSKATVMVKVAFNKDNDLAGVLPEMSARVSFLSQAISDSAKDEKPKKVVSADAITERNGEKVVFTVSEGKLHSAPVKVGGAIGAGAVELIAGPPQGTKVVVKPTSETADGQRIKEADAK